MPLRYRSIYRPSQKLPFTTGGFGSTPVTGSGHGPPVVLRRAQGVNRRAILTKFGGQRRGVEFAGWVQGWNLSSYPPANRHRACIGNDAAAARASRSIRCPSRWDFGRVRSHSYAASPRDRFDEISKSEEIWNRSRSFRTIDMLSSRLPFNTSLTRLGVPRSGTRSDRERPCCSIK